MTDCNTQFSFSGILSTPVVVDFNGCNLTSDAGVLHVFVKKTEKTRRRAIELALARMKEIRP